MKYFEANIALLLNDKMLEYGKRKLLMNLKDNFKMVLCYNLLFSLNSQVSRYITTI